jgi:hypothetical protein
MIPVELLRASPFSPEAHGFPFLFVPIVIFTQLLTRDIDR